MAGTTNVTVLTREMADKYGWGKKIARVVVNAAVADLDMSLRDESGRYPTDAGMKVVRAVIDRNQAPAVRAVKAVKSTTAPQRKVATTHPATKAAAKDTTVTPISSAPSKGRATRSTGQVTTDKRRSAAATKTATKVTAAAQKTPGTGSAKTTATKRTVKSA